MDWVDNIARQCEPDKCKVFSIGSSLEGRDLKVIKVSQLTNRYTSHIVNALQKTTFNINALDR